MEVQFKELQHLQLSTSLELQLLLLKELLTKQIKVPLIRPQDHQVHQEFTRVVLIKQEQLTKLVPAQDIQELQEFWDHQELEQLEQLEQLEHTNPHHINHIRVTTATKAAPIAVEVEAELVNLKDQLPAAQPSNKEILRVAPTDIVETEDDLVN